MIDSPRCVIKPAAVSVLAAAVLLAGCAAKKPGSTAAAPEPKSAAKPPAEATVPCPPAPAAPQASRPQMLSDGLVNYEAGRYADALRNFEALDSDGSADGMVLYRLAFCYGATGSEDKSKATYERSRDMLKAREVSGAATVEERFYLVNVLLNLDASQDAKATATRAIAAIESCKTPVPAGGMGSFRVGKLYGDAGNRERQAAWYRRALKEFESDPAAPAAYVQRATAGVASWEVGRSGWKESIPHLAKMRETNPSDPDLLIALLVAQLHAGDVAGADTSLAALPSIADRRRDEVPYLKGLTRTVKRMAASGIALPDTEPDGITYADIPTDTLVGVERDVDGTTQPRNGLLQKLAMEGSSLLTAAPGDNGGVVEKRGPKLAPILVPSPETMHRIDAVQARFVSACLEVLRRGLPLQEIGFTSSISPFVVHDWRGLWIQQHRAKDEGSEGDAAGSPDPGAK